MKREDYINEMVEDIKAFVKDNIGKYNLKRDDIEDKLYDDLWYEDSVTGHRSGSYTSNPQKAKENIDGAEDVIREMAEKWFGCKDDKIFVGEHFLNKDWEWFDVNIRCYLLREAISIALDELRWHPSRLTDEEKAHQIAWEDTKHYDPNVCKQEWVEMGAREMAAWKDEQFAKERKELIAKANQAVTYSHESGAIWMKECLIEKAMKWLIKGGYFVNSTETIEDFKKAMEE